MYYSLKSDYISVKSSDRASYGGSQLMSSHKYLRQCGCGVVACCDLLAYLAAGQSHVSYFCGKKEFTLEKYDELLLKLSHRYFQVIPPFGTNGIALASGLNIFFAKKKLKYFAVWDVANSTIFSKIGEMLSDDIPVIISVGPNFPQFWRSEKITLYRKLTENEYRPAYLAKAHFMTVTGMDDEWLCVSSWGKKLYMKRTDYTDYIKKHSNSVVSNICYIKRTALRV